jgi:dihydroxyacetone kinase-like protein
MADHRLDARFVMRWIDILDRLVVAAEPQLTEFDAAIGDADHGANMTRATCACKAVLGDVPPPTTSDALSEVGQALAEYIGGASGPLYGAIFLALGKSVPSTPDIGTADFVAGMREALISLHDLGAAVVGDKTMVDAIAPAVAELEQLVSVGVPFPEATAAAARAAARGARSTIPLRARKGRAAYLGPRSEGHQDPGATSSALLFEALSLAVGP